MKRLGVVGGIASGKSQVARLFESWGASRIDGDELGHLVLGEPEVRETLRKRWGDDVLDDQGQLDRRVLASIVFQKQPAGAEELSFLESVTHPRIEQRIGERIDEAVQSGKTAVVIDAAVMLKAGWDRHCDYLIFVDATRAVRLERAKQRGWTEKQFAAREATQWPIEQKRERCDFCLDNSSAFEATRLAAAEIWKTILSR